MPIRIRTCRLGFRRQLVGKKLVELLYAEIGRIATLLLCFHSLKEDLMLPRPDQKTIATIKHAASLLSGAARRAFQAQTVLDHCNGNLSHAKTLFGWHQETVQRGLLESKQGQAIPDRKGRGRKKITERLPSLQADIRSLVDPRSCAKFVDKRAGNA